jgi:drug/metabolite transporter (DMT)-like permease
MKVEAPARSPGLNIGSLCSHSIFLYGAAEAYGAITVNTSRTRGGGLQPLLAIVFGIAVLLEHISFALIVSGLVIFCGVCIPERAR